MNSGDPPEPSSTVEPALRAEADPVLPKVEPPPPEIKTEPGEPVPIANTKSRKRKQAAPQQFKPSIEDEEEEVVESSDALICSSDIDDHAVDDDTSSPVGPDSSEGEKHEDSGPTRMLPVHCKVEFAAAAEPENQSRDDYAIIPSNVKLCDLVKSALTKLGYEEDLRKQAEGTIQLKNWKPLSFSTIADKDDVTVGALFNDVLSHLTLNIKIDNSPKDEAGNTTPSASCGAEHTHTSKGTMFGGAVSEVRRRLLQVLERRGATLLVSHGCPFSQTTIAAILQGHYSKHITPSRLQAFYRWFNLYTSLTDYTVVSPDEADRASHCRSRFFSPGRTLFDPMTEVPKLMKWFKQCPRPSRGQLEVYLAELNSSDYRKQGMLLQYSSIAIWFKNARVKYRSFSRDRLHGGKRKPPGGTKGGETGRGDKENEPVDLSQPEHLRNRDAVSEDRRKPPGPETPNAARNGVGSDLSPVVPTSIVPSSLPGPPGQGTPGKGPPVLLVPAAAHFTNGYHHLPAQMLMQPQHIALQQNMAAAFPRPGMIGAQAGPMGLQPHLMVGQAPMAVQSPFPPFLDMRRLQDYAGPQSAMVGQPPMAGQPAMPTGVPTAAMTPGGQPPSALHGGRQGPPSQNGQQLSIPNYTPGKSPAVNGMTTPSQPIHQSVHQSPPVIKVEPLDSGELSNESMEEGDEPRGPTPGVIHEAIPSMVSHSYGRSGGGGGRPTRKRFNIDYAHDLPKLQEWFDENMRPDRDTIERYVDELNSSEFRASQQEKYTPRVVYVWFKNARAKLLRGQKLSQRWHQLMSTDPAAAAAAAIGQLNGGEMQYDEEEMQES